MQYSARGTKNDIRALQCNIHCYSARSKVYFMQCSITQMTVKSKCELIMWICGKNSNWRKPIRTTTVTECPPHLYPVPSPSLELESMVSARLGSGGSSSSSTCIKSEAGLSSGWLEAAS
eukprot:scpid79136/ scgid7296/ 